MLRNSFGQDVSPETSIFPLLVFDERKQYYKCIGTGFFIEGGGGFVTAKHVLFDNDGNRYKYDHLIAVQSSSDGQRFKRIVRQVYDHPTADISVGYLGPTYLNHIEQAFVPPITSAFQINLNRLANGEEIESYSFPLTKNKDLNNDEQLFTFTGRWEYGKIVDFHENGMSLLRNPCYQTSMFIEHGASGGPVLNHRIVIGVNSTGMKLLEGEPISCVTPISLLQDIIVDSSTGKITVSDLVKYGAIVAYKG